MWFSSKLKYDFMSLMISLKLAMRKILIEWSFKNDVRIFAALESFNLILSWSLNFLKNAEVSAARLLTLHGGDKENEKKQHQRRELKNEN